MVRATGMIARTGCRPKPNSSGNVPIVERSNVPQSLMLEDKPAGKGLASSFEKEVRAEIVDFSPL